jgi:hypothetical protein
MADAKADPKKPTPTVAADKAAPAAPAAKPAPEPEPTADAPAAPKPGRFRVSLKGVKVRYEDPEKGTIGYRDYLDVDASNHGEAWMKFRDYNGIRGSEHQPEITPLPA